MKNTIRLQCIGMLALMIALSIPSAAVGFTPGWSIQTWDSEGDAGRYTSIALDSSGNPHISYYDATYSSLTYAVWTGSPWYDPWNISTPDSSGDVGRYSSMVLDSANRVHISYYSATNGDLKYAKWNGSAWSITTVDSAGVVGYYTSIALDSSDNPRISYYNATNGDLKYAEWIPGKFGSWYWSIQTVDSAGSVGSYTSLAIDSSGNPHISYHDLANRDLKYAKKAGGVWMNQTIDSAGSAGIYSSL